MENKRILIKQENGEIKFETDGFSEMEIIGLLSYYKDFVQIEALKRNIEDYKLLTHANPKPTKT